MGARSIIDVDVNDDRFKAFLDLYSKYESGLKKAAPHWKASERSAEAAAQATAHITAETKKQATLQQQVARAREKADRDAEKAQRKRLDDAKKRMDNIRDTTKSIAGFLASGTANLVKWVGIGGILTGLLGAGGLFGLDRLAASVGDARRSAQGLGITSGQQKAFGINFGRYVDPNSNLNAIAEAKSNYANRWAFSAMGVNPNGKDPAQLAVEMALKAKQVFDKGDGSQQYAQAHGLLQFYSMDELRRLHSISMKELNSAEHGYGRDARALALGDGTQRKWQDLSVQMERAGAQIKNVLVDGLTPLVGPLKELSSAVAETLKSLLQNPHLKDWIKDFGEGIEALGQYLGSDKFQTDMKEFAENVALIAQKIVDALKFLNLIPSDRDTSGSGSPDRAEAGKVVGGILNRGGAGATEFLTGGGVAKATRSVEQYFEKTQGWTRAGASGIAAQFQAESGMNPFNVGDHGAAYGIGQWHPDRQADYERLFGHSMRSVRDRDRAFAEQLWFANYELTKGKYQKVGAAMRVEKDSEVAGAMGSMYYERPKNKEAEARSRGALAHRIEFTINNQTGGNANVQANQAAAR